MRNCPFGCPEKAKLDSGLRMYFPLLQLMGNSALDRSLLLASTMQISQQPKMGPLSGLLAMANWARLRLNFSRMLSEKMKDFNDLSAAHCFFAELHPMGVYPPMTFPNSVSMMVTVPACPSHFLWNSLMEKECSLARKSSFSEDTFASKSRWMAETSCTMRLSKPEEGEGLRSVMGGGEWGTRLSRLVPGFRQRSLVRSINSPISSCNPTISLSTSVGSSTLLAASSSAAMGAKQFPLSCVQLPSVRFLMNFMTSREQPQVLTQVRNLACSALMRVMRVANMPSILSRTQWKSADRRPGLSYTAASTYAQRTLLQPSWKRLHSSLLDHPFQQMSPGLRQLGFVQAAKAVLPQMHSGLFPRGSADVIDGYSMIVLFGEEK